MFVKSKCLQIVLKNEAIKPIQRFLNTTSVLCSSTGEARKTSLYEFHVKNGGKMVEFANHLLPVQYSDMNVSESHVHTRKKASVFDVSHMLQTLVKGRDCVNWFETLCPVDLKGLKDGGSALTVFMNENGGILDDLIVTKIDSNNLYIVSNAGRMEHDKNHMLEYLNLYQRRGMDVDLKFLDVSERALIAIQGPKAIAAVQNLSTYDFTPLYFMNSKVMTLSGVEDCRVTRCGYTGEDGVEISVPADKAEYIVQLLMRNPNVRLAGLGARDTLRLEAGLCLYGNDIDHTITPVEANLTWLIAKRRRVDFNFIGADVVLQQIKKGVKKRRVGLILEDNPPARSGSQILDSTTEEVIGTVTSGCPSPSLSKKNIAMGYVLEKYKSPKTKLSIKIRNNLYPGEIVKMPFIESNYYTQ